MIRLVVSSVAIVGMALAASLTTAFWMNRLTGPGEAQAAVPVVAPVRHAAVGVPAQVARARDGHYWAEARIDGRAVRVMIDTGATVVALTRDDAVRLGLHLNRGDFTRTVMTASGPVAAAAVELGAVAVAGARVEKVDALVVQDGLEHSLLGMSYLGRLSAFEATPTGLTLKP